ncbi:acylphosphatase [uncultured Ilyobacter sp.]|jgi:acylphosphatase|uniref:acylphosphatase n=1 Tax=uncultured Ilyobacter sp. TaxID=544433 RepID=UPI0029C0058B|nr:acylphosphatase [uncultured Ilyobacter sp.]
MLTHHFIVKGRVQGVGFRFFTYHIANEYKIKGWVKNLWNGNVEIVAQGEPKYMDVFKKLIEEGPPSSRVKSIEEDVFDSKKYDDFNIEY